MVTVVATQELKVGDFLLRFKAEAPHINGSRSISARPVVFLFHFFVGSLVCVCVCMCVCMCVYVLICGVFLLMFDFCTVHGNSTCFLVAGSPIWKRVQN